MHHVALVAATAVLVPTLASAQAITTIGSSAAQACYEAARDRHRSQAALANCEQALNGALSAADLVATHVNRGILFALRANFPLALQDYDKAISLDPDLAEAYLNKGLLLLRVPKREREALAVINLAIEKRTTKPAIAFVARAIAHEGLGDFGAAYRDYQQAAILDPKWDLPVRELRRFRAKS